MFASSAIDTFDIDSFPDDVKLLEIFIINMEAGAQLILAH